MPKIYVMDVRVMPKALWSSYTMGEERALKCTLCFVSKETSALSLDSVDCENPVRVSAWEL